MIKNRKKCIFLTEQESFGCYTNTIIILKDKQYIYCETFRSKLLITPRVTNYAKIILSTPGVSDWPIQKWPANQRRGRALRRMF